LYKTNQKYVEDAENEEMATKEGTRKNNSSRNIDFKNLTGFF
jgi:hypothetical protein